MIQTCLRELDSVFSWKDVFTQVKYPWILVSVFDLVDPLFESMLVNNNNLKNIQECVDHMKKMATANPIETERMLEEFLMTLSAKDQLSIRQFALAKVGIRDSSLSNFEFMEKKMEFASGKEQFDFSFQIKQSTRAMAEKRKSWLLKSAKNGYELAQEKLVTLHFPFDQDISTNTTGVATNAQGVAAIENGWKTKAFAKHRGLAKDGYAESQNILGYFYSNGIGINKDPQKALKWFRRAANQNHLGAMYNLSECYRHASGVEKNEKVAFTLLNRTISSLDESVEQGQSQGQGHWYVAIGECYEHGTGTAKNHQKAFEMYTIGATTFENANAKIKVGSCFAHGIGTKQDDAKALEWYRLAAEQGSILAKQYFSALLKRSQSEQLKNLTQDTIRDYPVNNFEWYHQAAYYGNSYFQHIVGLCYLYGYGYGHGHSDRGYDNKASINIRGNANVGEISGKTAGKKALFWFEKAGYAVSYVCIATCHEYGLKNLEIPVNLDLAEQWYYRALTLILSKVKIDIQSDVKKDDTPSSSATAVTPPSVLATPPSVLATPICDSKQRIFSWYQKQLNLHPDSSYLKNQLGICYQHKFNQNNATGAFLENAIKLFKEAANQGYAEAQNNLAFCCEINQQFAQAVEWYQKAANQNLKAAQHNLGMCFEHGKGVVSNLQRAKQLYSLAKLDKV